MKIFNKLASALMVLPMLAALTACESDAEYTAPEALSNAQVYFANDLETSVALSGDETSFDVIVNRQNPKGELSVAIKAEQDENNLFTIPLAVTFADGEKEAKLTIAYDPTVMEFNDMHPISLSIADEETYSTPYGNVSYDFEAGIRPPFSAWATNANELAELTGSDVNILGTQTKEFTGTYLYTQFFSGADPELPVAFRMNKAFPEQVQFKVGKWGYGVDLIMDAVYDEECQLYRINVPTTFIGYVHPSYGKVYAVESITYAKENVESMDRDWMHDYIENYDGPNWQKYCSYYDPATGEFVLNLTYFVDLGYFGYGEEYLTMDGYVRKDYSAAVSYAGMLKTAEGEFQAVADLTLGRHIATAKYAVVDGTIEDIDAAIAIMSGEVESTTI